MKKSFQKAVVGLALFVAASSGAKSAHALGNYPYAIPCTGCSNPSIITTLRESYSNQSSWFVYDLNSGILRYYTKTPAPVGKPFGIQESQPDARAQAYWNEVMDFYRRNGGSLKLNVTVDVVVAPSTAVASFQSTGSANGAMIQPFDINVPNVTAWEAVNEGVNRQKVMNYLNTQSESSQSGIFARAAELTGTTYAKITTVFGGVSRDQLALNIQALDLMVTTRYPDGSSQRYSWDPLNHSWVYVPHTSVDSSGNTIPDGPSDVAGQNGNVRVYSFGGTASGVSDSIQWFQRVRMFQVSAPSPAAPALIACVTSNGSTVCTRQN
jgi:hypothetical protein